MHILCKSDDCERPVHAKGLCSTCLQRARVARLRESGITCTVTDCQRSIYNVMRGMCRPCYERFLAFGDPLSHGNRPDLGKTLEQRFWEKVDKSGDCWIWTAGLTRGYGQFIVMRGKRGYPVRAHRLAWELTRGPIPDGLDLDHLCHNRNRSCPGGDTCPHRRCVNPDHLEPVTNEENIRRGMWSPAVHARQTHCVNDHEFTPENTYRRPDTGTRVCRTCQRERNRKIARARREAKRAA
jgi:HNH endonuclease